MDPITQSLLGAAAAQAVLGNRLGRVAALAGAVGGELPDADIFLPMADPAMPMEYHRHFTHALLFVPVVAAVATLPFLIRARWRSQWKLIFMAATLGAATHGLLDTCTTYGTYLLWPFVNHRLAWDIISIIDPLFTLTLLIGVSWAVKTRTTVPARIGIALAIAYLGLGCLQHHRATRVQTALADTRGQTIERGRVMPTLANLVVWRSVYESEARLHADAIRVGRPGSALVRQGRSLPRVGLDDMPVDSPRVREIFGKLDAFADGYVTSLTGFPRVFGDMRYSMDPSGFNPIWGIRVEPEGTQPEVVWLYLSTGRPSAVQDLWRSVLSKKGWEEKPLAIRH
jgi:inner membrane protein